MDYLKCSPFFSKIVELYMLNHSFSNKAAKFTCRVDRRIHSVNISRLEPQGLGTAQGWRRPDKSQKMEQC